MMIAPNSGNVQGIVLAGVHAWGESLLEEICCRPLLPVLGRPLVWHVLDWLARGGISRASICANSDTGIFKGCLGTGRVAGVELNYYADLMPRGPAGCMRDAADKSTADIFVVVDGSIVTGIDLAELVAAHRWNHAELTVVVAEKAGTTASEPTGIYVVSRAALDQVPDKGYQDIKEMLIPRLYEQGQRVAAYSVPAGAVLRVTSAASYLSVVAWALQAAPCLPGRYNRIGQALVHASSYIARSARLIGPAIIGPGCVLDEAATVLGPTCVGPDCTLGRGAVVSRTTMWPACRIGKEAFVDHSVLTSGSTVEAGLVVRDTVWMPRRSETAPLPARGLYWAMAEQPEITRHLHDIDLPVRMGR